MCVRENPLKYIFLAWNDGNIQGTNEEKDEKQQRNIWFVTLQVKFCYKSWLFYRC